MPPRRILYLSRWWPAPPDNGSRLRIRGQLEALAARYEVTLVSFKEPGQTADARDLADVCRAEAILRRPYDARSRRARLAYISPTPRSLVDVFSPEMQAAVAREAPAHDAIVATNIEMAQYQPAFAGRPAVLEELELGGPAQAAHRGSATERMRARLTWMKLTRHLRHVLPHFAACTVASELERDLVRRAVPGFDRVFLVENSVDAGALTAAGGERRPDSIVFAGALSFAANRDAMDWFVGRVMPHVRAEVPEAELAITGPQPQPPFATPPGVRLTGWLDDVGAFVASSGVSVAPVRRGGGTRLKILEAMALGTPVVATSKGAEGLAVIHGEHLLIADDAEAFAAQVVRLLRQPELRRRLATAARALVERRYDKAIVNRAFTAVVDRIVAAGNGERTGA